MGLEYNPLMARNNIVIIGLGRLGAGIAERAAAKGEDVIVIDKNPSSFARLDDTFSGFTIAGDATDLSFLEGEEVIQSAKEVVITTGNDNVNLLLAHVCSTVFEVPKIFVRFDDPDKSVCIAGFPNIKAIYPFELTLTKFDLIEEEGEE